MGGEKIRQSVPFCQVINRDSYSGLPFSLRSNGDPCRVCQTEKADPGISGLPFSLCSNGDPCGVCQTEKADPGKPGCQPYFFFAPQSTLWSQEKNKAVRLWRFSLFCVGGRWDSNPRPSEPQSDILTS